MKFRVYLVADASVSTSVEVEADSREEAEKKAQKQAEEGNVEWQYGGADDTTIEVVEVRERP